MPIARWTVFLITAAVLSGCGEKASPKIQISLTPVSALTDATSTDVVFIVTNIPNGTTMLDTNGDGAADTFVMPSNCGADLAASCGVKLATPATVDIGNLPLNYNYKIDARVRNAAGTALFTGTTTFSNVTPVQPVSITLTAVP